MLQKTIITCCLVFLTTTLFAQTKATDAVHLHNGSLIRGTIVEHLVDDHVKIMTVEGKIYEFSATEVKEVVVGSSIVVAESKAPKLVDPQKRGFYNVSTVGILLGQDEWQQTNAAFSATIINGYQFNQHFSLGLGVGIEHFESLHFPAFLDARFHFRRAPMSPFIAMKGGYGIPAAREAWRGQTENYGGVLFGAELGVRNYSSDKFGLVFSAGYHRQRLKSVDNIIWEPGTSIDRITNLNRISIRFGLLFN